MNPQRAVSGYSPELRRITTQATLDLTELAGIGHNDKVRLQNFAHRTYELFDRTLKIIETVEVTPAAHERPAAGMRFIPQEKDLRSRFKFAEALGSYSTLNSLLDRYAPAYQLTRAIDEPSLIAEISPREIRILEEYRDQIESALHHVSEHPYEYSVSEFSADELQELNDILHEARDRLHVSETVIGMRLIHDVEQSLQALHQIYGKIQPVQGTISGVFIVDSEIMFMPCRTHRWNYTAGSAEPA